MNDEDMVRTSKFLSLILRHKPGRAGLVLDSAGWVDVDLLLVGVNRSGFPLDRDGLMRIVATNEKQRFAMSDDGLRIRANQGHSVEVDLEYAPMTPPELLYHGTASRFVESIRSQGLLKMQRHHVHLSEETKMTLQVGARRGRPVLLTIRSGEMHRAGHVFFRTTNRVWLTDHVPAQFLRFPDSMP